MGNISYFCIVKRFKRYLRYIVLAFFLLLTHQMRAQADSVLLAKMDSVEVSLLTCQPRQYIYSLYGHTAIRITDHAHGTDFAVNYGLFSFDKPFFILRFVFGLTDYEMGIIPYEPFRQEYEQERCGVRQQVLNLSRADKLAILQAIDANNLPENRVYRYNYFYDNCTTRARDIIINNINGQVRYAAKGETPSYRDMIHAYTEGHPWARFGNDLLLGVAADNPTDARQQQFLPFNLSDDWARASVTAPDRSTRPLVARTFWAITPQAQTPDDTWTPTPLMCAAVLALVILSVCARDAQRKRLSWGLDIVLMALCGLAGLILLAMVFSQHPTVRVNLQILLLNPLALFMLYPTAKALRHQRRCLWLTVGPICLVLFFIGTFWQTYAEGMCILALSLLVRAILVNYIVRTSTANPIERKEQ